MNDLKRMYEILCPWKPYRLWTSEDKKNCALLCVVALGMLAVIWMESAGIC